jgi:Tat protein secretion system quality control protein TatD with DNase activity
VCGVCPGVDWDRVLYLHSRYPGVIWPQLGLHPWWIVRFRESNNNNMNSNVINDNPFLKTLSDLRNMLENVLQLYGNVGVGKIY